MTKENIGYVKVIFGGFDVFCVKFFRGMVDLYKKKVLLVNNKLLWVDFGSLKILYNLFLIS